MWSLFVALAMAVASGRSTQPVQIQKHKCQNGLEVLVVENHAVPLITIEIAAKNGSMTESPEYNGLSHLYEHMFFKANAALPNQQAYMTRARELGMVWNGTTNTERVNYFFTTTSDHTKDAMVFMRDAIVSPLFEDKELERERVVVTGEIDRNEANPIYHFLHTVNGYVWWKYPSYKDPLGNRKTVLSATRAKMETIQKRYYIPNNSVLVVTGDVVAADIFAQADALYRDWKAGPNPFVKHPLVTHPPLRGSDVVLIEQPVQSVSGQLTWHGPSTVGASARLTYAADVLGVALGVPSSKFQKALVDSGACVGASFLWYTQVNTGPINLAFEAAPDKVDVCVQAIQTELLKLATPYYITDEEMRAAAHVLELIEVHDREKPSELAHSITFWWTSAGLDYMQGYIDQLYKVTRGEVAEFVASYITGKPFVFGVLLAPELRAGGLDKAHFEALLGLAKRGQGKAVPR